MQPVGLECTHAPSIPRLASKALPTFPEDLETLNGHVHNKVTTILLLASITIIFARHSSLWLGEGGDGQP